MIIYKRVYTRQWLIAVLTMSIFFGSSNADAKSTKPLVWDMAELEQMRKGNFQFEHVQSIIKDADQYCAWKPVTITEKTHTFAPDVHYYCSMSIYWWPNLDNLNGEYIRRDGVINPESYKYDYSRLLNLSTRCKSLSYAFYLTKDKKYYRAFIEQLRVWFLEKGTYMYPNFEYSQVVPGSNNKGKSSGMIDAYIFNDIIESIRLVNSVNRIERKTMMGLKNWFLKFVEWSDNTYGEIMKNGKQNISIAYDVILTNMYLFIGENNKARKIVDEFADKRLYIQIEEDGSQPAELIRTRAIFYSLYNLTHIIDYCFLVRELDADFFNKHSERIEKAIEYIKYYIDNPELCPYRQITNWQECGNMLNNLLVRRTKLNKD